MCIKAENMYTRFKNAATIWQIFHNFPDLENFKFHGFHNGDFPGTAVLYAPCKTVNGAALRPRQGLLLSQQNKLMLFANNKFHRVIQGPEKK